MKITKTTPTGTLELVLSDRLVLKVIRSTMENYPEASMTIVCHGWDYKKLEFDFIDADTGKEHTVTKDMLIKAFPLIFTDKWSRGLTQPPTTPDKEAWEDWLCQCDAFDTDGLAQLAIFGEIIYG